MKFGLRTSRRHKTLLRPAACLGSLLAGALLLCGAAGLAADQIPALEDRIAAILDKPAARRAFWGVRIVDLDSGETVYDNGGEKLFVPASNAKLYSTALALERLGPDHQFSTIVVAESPLQEDGSVSGSLRLIGGGDPNLSSRVIPFDPKIEFRRDRLAPITQLARQISEAGVKQIEGDIIGDDRRYVWQPYPAGWSLGDAAWSYGAPASALSFNDNEISIVVRPGAGATRPARLTIRPNISYYKIRNQTRTAATRTVAQSIGMRRPPDSHTLTLWGEISIRSPGRELSLAVDDPALFTATALKAELESLGVTVGGEARADHSEPGSLPSLKRMKPRPRPDFPETLAVVASAPLSDALQAVNKHSVNLHAEMLLREVGYVARGVGSREAGVEEMRSFLKTAGLSPWEFFLSDAAGLSRHNLVSPSGTVKLLQHMWGSPNRDVYINSLPTAGVDGTLDWRFSRTSAKGRVHAKTGTLTHATALAGYIEAASGRHLAFSIFINNFGVSTSYIRKLADQIVVEVVQSE